MKKRISNRKHPTRTCKKPDCKEEYTPTDKRQVYCTPQHRVDHNNDLRDLKGKPHKSLKEIVVKNQQILAKLYRLQEAKKHTRFYFQVLELDGFDVRYYTDVTISNGSSIYWNYHYGLQGVDVEKKQFITHFRENLPF